MDSEELVKNRIAKNLLIITAINLSSLFISRFISAKIISLLPNQQISLNVHYLFIFLNRYWYLYLFMPLLYFIIDRRVKKTERKKFLFFLFLAFSMLALLFVFVIPIIFIFPFH